MLTLDYIFSENGPFAYAIPGFKRRSQQVEMAQAIGDAIENRSVLLAEAGTGTGKTFAYLVPALLSGGKTIISTGTKTLQDQLFNKDIPVVRAALKVPVIVAMLKGRANYVCRHRLQIAQEDGRFTNRLDVQYLRLIERYANVSDTGDKSDLGTVPEEATIWPQVTSTRDNCLGQECGHFKQCFVMEARKKALAADVVVVNHHLFFADLMLRDEGIAELLPASNTVIFDEAHQLPQTASLFFGESFSTNQLLELARDTRIQAQATARDLPALAEFAEELETAVKKLRPLFDESSARLTSHKALSSINLKNSLRSVENQLIALRDVLQTQAQRSPELDNCLQRSELLAELISNWGTTTDTDAAQAKVCWLEILTRSMQFHATPLSIAEIFRKQLSSAARAWIFTSATLAVDRDFNHYRIQMGLPEATGTTWPSPFNYPGQALLYVPKNLPDPASADYTKQIITALIPIIKASKGRAFLLFTTLRAMQEAHKLLTQALAEHQLNFPLLMQGLDSRNRLLQKFKEYGNAVLIASHSFWEGVDVRGEALSLVMIDKIPFAPPDDPVLAARIAQINRQGGNAFMDYQLPHAVITLKQGAGRLIRDETDRGILMLCDPRLLSKSYGRKILQSLPPMRRTRALSEVQHFFDDKTLSESGAAEVSPNFQGSSEEAVRVS